MDRKSREGPIDPDLHDSMMTLGQVLQDAIDNSSDDRNRKLGFVLLLFDFGAGGRMNYISNAARQDMIAMLKELVAKLEGRAPEGDECTS